LSSLDKDRWDAVSPYLDQAMEMDPGELASWLEALRAGRPELAGDLEELLRDRESLGDEGFLEGPSPGAPPADRGLVTIGPYRLMHLLGEGGMGVVYVAEQTGPIRRLVAIKVIRPGLDSAHVLSRFAVERQTLANLDHPGISKVYDAGATEDGRPYVAMEYVDGTTLTRYCDEHRLTVRERLQLFLQVCAAIQHAHQKGVIHRDIKPSNLLVSIVDGRPFVKVIDFGIAKALTTVSGEEPLFTQTGATLGTPEYMSPEQASAGGSGVDTRSDVYALGVVLYELLVGARPFEAMDLPHGSPLALLETIRDKDPPKPTARLLSLHGAHGVHGALDEVAARRGTDSKRLLRDLGGELEWISLRALEKQPARRYASPAEMAADIERHLAGGTVLAGPPSTLYRVRKLVRRHRVGAAALAATAVGAVALAAAAFWFQHIQRQRAEERSRQEASLRARAQQAERQSREQLRESLLNQARALTSSSDPDGRTRSLAALKQAAAISPGLDLRNAALAAMATNELRVIRQWSPSLEGSLASQPDRLLRSYVRGYPDGTVSVHAIEDDSEIARLPGVGKPFATGELSPDGTWLAVKYLDSGMRVWRLKTRESPLVIANVDTFVFTPDSRRLIATCGGDSVRIFDVSSGRELFRQSTGSRDGLMPGGVRRHVALHPTEPIFMISGNGWRKIEIRRVSDGALQRYVSVPEMGMRARWGADGKSLITAHSDFSIGVWNWPAMGTPRLVLRYHRAEPVYLATDPSGRWLASAAWDNQAFFFDLQDGRLLTSQALQKVYGAADRPAFLLVSDRLWSLVAFEPPIAFEAVTTDDVLKSPREVVFSPTGRWLASSGEGGIRILDRRSGEVHTLMNDEMSLGVSFTADSRGIHAVTRDRLRAWRIEEDQATGGFAAARADVPGRGDRTFRSAVTGGTFANGDQWVTIGKDPSSHLPSWIHGRFDSTEFAASGGLTIGSSGPEVSPDGRWLAWGNWHGRNAAVTRLGGHDTPVELPVEGHARIAFSPDNRLLLVGGAEAIRAYEIGTWRELYTIPRIPPLSLSPSFAFTHDARIGAVTFPPNRVLLFDTRSGEELASLSADQYMLAGPGFSPDAGALAAASTDHHILIWDIAKLRGFLRDLGLDWDSE
jgi:serine/threonine protein kinase